ncbi:MAG TPA: hypothetical protein VJA26_00525 [Gammaproteobacteria bacterium]|nr:hypothetical protein [Gammaproteobacteria bacterium]
MGRVDKSTLCVLGMAIAGLASGPASAQGFGGGPTAEPSAIRSVPAETTAAAVTQRNWKAPRTSWGHPSLEGVWSTDDMRSVPTNRPETFGTRDTLTEEEFRQRASRDEGGKDSAANRETFLRNEWGIRTFGYSSLVIDPPNGRVPEMTAAGKARAAPRDRGTFGPGPFDDFEDFTLYDRCITRGVLGSTLPVIYGNGIRIAQNPTSVAISYEMIHDTRIIPLNGRPHVSDDIRQYLGNARGHWEGETLVVETTNFTDKTSIGGNGNGTRHSRQLKLTERFTRVDPDMIQYVATVDDPVTYTAPFTFRLMITTQPNYETYEYSCHEGNGAVGHSLSGERAYERQVAEAIAKGEPVPPRATGIGIYGAPREGADVFDINAGE